MRNGNAWTDLPRYMARNTPWWLARTNFIVWLVAIILGIAGVRWWFWIFAAWVLFNFAWSYGAWRRAGRPRIDEQPDLAIRQSLLKSLWPPRDKK